MAGGSLPAGVPDDALAVARIGRPHGVRGELRLRPESEDPGRLLALERAWVVARDGAVSAVRIVSMRRHGGVALARFEGIESPEAAGVMTNGELWARACDLPAWEGDSIGVADIVGHEMWDEGRRVGPIVSVSSGGGRDYFEVEHDGRRVLIPAVKDWWVERDPVRRRIVMRLPAGLLDE